MLLGDPVVWSELTDPSPSNVASLAFDETLSFRASKDRATMIWEREYLRELLARHSGNLSRAARAARMDRTHLRELGRKYNLVHAAQVDHPQDD